MKALFAAFLVLCSVAANAVTAQDQQLFNAARAGTAGQVAAALAAGAELEATNQQGMTPLMVAAINKNQGAVAALLRAGANPNHANAKGQTVLMAAVVGGDLEVVRLLLDKGADPSLSTPDRKTALGLARSQNKAAILGMLEKYRMNLPDELNLTIEETLAYLNETYRKYPRVNLDDKGRWHVENHFMYRLVPGYLEIIETQKFIKPPSSRMPPVAVTKYRAPIAELSYTSPGGQYGSWFRHTCNYGVECWLITQDDLTKEMIGNTYRTINTQIGGDDVVLQNLEKALEYFFKRLKSSSKYNLPNAHP